MDHPDWQSIRPWSRRFALFVKEISSVSVTLIISSTLNTLDDTEESLASLALTLSDDEETHPRTVTDTLSENISVKVNNVLWQRVLLRVDEEVDEAVVIVFGLIPGRQYDIELGITPQNEWLRSQITTKQISDRLETSKDEHASHTSDSDRLHSALSSESPSMSPTAIASPLDAPSHSASPPPTFTIEDRIQQLNHTLSMLQTERESLSGSLKGARKDAQKADASIRAEIDSLKRASDKYASIEHRARQKVLALQEAAKQNMAATAETHARVLETEANFPILMKKKEEAEEEYKLLKEKAENTSAEKMEIEKTNRQDIESIQSELAGLGHKLEKLYGKQEKLMAGTIPELEEELRRISMENEKVEKEQPSLDNTPEEIDVDDDHDSYRSYSEVSGSNLIQQRRKHSPLREQLQHPPIQRPIQILRQTPQSQHLVIANKSSSTSSTSTLSRLARPFEPSSTRQAQLQNTLQSSVSPPGTIKSDLNPSSTVFSPRLALAYQQSKWTPRSLHPDAGGQA